VRILGIVSDTHDSGIALLQDGAPELVIEEERLSRRKHTWRFPEYALRAAFDERGLGIGDVEAITIPWDIAKLRRTFATALLRRFPASLDLLRQAARPTQRDGILALNFRLARNLRRHFGASRLPPLVNVGHHDSHAAVFFVSPFEDATILVMDGYGDDASTSVYTGNGNRVQRHWHTGIFNSLGMVYTFMTQYLGFGGFAEEGKVMALAAMGGPAYVERFGKLIRLEPDGRYQIDMSYFDYDAHAMLQPFRPKFMAEFGPPRRPGEPLSERHIDLAFALQAVTEDAILHIVRALEARFPSRNLIITGGVALNCVANGRVARDAGFRNVWVPPVASDSGAPLGAALWHQHQTMGRPRGFVLDSVSYGLEYGAEAIEAALTARGLRYEHLPGEALQRRVALDIADGRIVGWYQGRFEMGPRALGNRSLLADPRRVEMKDILNARIKSREYFRPFAPAVLAEHAGRFFEMDGPDPYMTKAPRVRPEMRSVIPAAVHVDGTARVQTVERKANERYYDLIAAFGELTGVPVVINTSFNEREPIVARPEEAIACFLRTDLDVLAIGDFYCDDRGQAGSSKVQGDAAARSLDQAAGTMQPANQP
jgi:carbamoyltransferase